MKKRKVITSLAVAMIMTLSSTVAAFANVNDVEIPSDNYETVDFSVSDIQGGIKIVDGKEHKMSKEEAQATYLAGLQNSSEDMTDLEQPTITPRVVVSTKITSRRVYDGAKKRVSQIYHNNTSTNMQKKISASYTVSATVSAGIDISKVASAFNASGYVNAKISVTAKYSMTDTVTIKPGQQFYVAFMPKLVDVSGTQVVTGHGGYATTKSFKGTFPKTVAGSVVDGNVYYIAK